MRLDQLDSLKFPLLYGGGPCQLCLGDSRFTDQIVALRNDAELGQHLSGDSLAPAEHESWLEGQLARRDALNFVVLVRGEFAGTASLYNIEAGVRCEYGRVVMPDTGVRVFAVAAEFLCMSFAFEVLGVGEIYCRVREDNRGVANLHASIGWSRDARFDQPDSSEGAQAGFSFPLAGWPEAFERHRRILLRTAAG
jgi:RimJ/RimL family protein N-acetyltransferase